MSSIYIAAPYELRDEAIEVMRDMIVRGNIVTSRWLIGKDVNCDESARMDLDDIDAAATLLLLNPIEYSNKGTGGRHTEVGYAIALSKRIIIIGARSNIFHYLDSIIVVDTVKQALEVL